jgi:hypothetical protein
MVEYLAYDQSPSNSSHARLMIAGSWLSSLMLQMIAKTNCVLGIKKTIPFLTHRSTKIELLYVDFRRVVKSEKV